MPVTITIDLKSSRALIGAVIAIIGGLITMVGSVLPWFEVALVGSIGGLDTDGVITLVVGVLAVILGAVACWLVASQEDKWVPWTTGALLYLTLAGLAVTAGRIIASYSSGIFDAVDGPFGGSVTLFSFGAGIWITLGGSIIAAGGGAFAFVGARKAQASDPNGTATWIGGAVVLSMAIAVLGATELAGRGPTEGAGEASGSASSQSAPPATSISPGGGQDVPGASVPPGIAVAPGTLQMIDTPCDTSTGPCVERVYVSSATSTRVGGYYEYCDRSPGDVNSFSGLIQISEVSGTEPLAGATQDWSSTSACRQVNFDINGASFADKRVQLFVSIGNGTNAVGGKAFTEPFWIRS